MKLSHRILCIEDDLSCRVVFEKYFSYIGGHMVALAETGQEGLKLAAEFKPDIILLDMIMPDMNGLMVLEQLESSPATQNIPVILVTGYGLSEGELDTAKTRRNFLMLQEKPMNLNDLLATIEATLLPKPRYASGTQTLTGAPEPV